MAQARKDLDDAEFNASGERFNVACFLCQQSAEKALKAFLYSCGEDPWGHSVAELATKATSEDPSFAGIAPEAALLDKYYIPTRYPNGLPGGIPSAAYGARDAAAALELARKVLEFVGAKVPALHYGASPPSDSA
ncbi:HEPN domain-containing protein [Gelria sp. Kuro-4]|uniref:HEPN domain-containing protein n=1 Tax=Gelria sp. Kuro-4 TaxID=2796927 RepID=UPI001BEFD7AB|nr:HEPN domain-containing protein [Gelria sp. Kuro-4]BCV24361.1 DNA-binding protein [Gelria sp. Kuro-4]